MGAFQSGYSQQGIPRADGPVQFWAQHKHVYPNLYVLARGTLCTPALLKYTALPILHNL